MKVLHILYSGLGGHGNVFFSMVNADLKREFDFAAIFNGIEPIRDEYVEQCKKKNIPFAYIEKKPGLHPGFFIKLYREIKKTNPDIIFLHGGIAVLPAWLAKLFSRRIKKIIVRETQANHLKNRGDWIRLTLSMMFANRIVFLSEEYHQEVAKKMGWIYSKKKSSVIPNGIDLNLYAPRPHTPSPSIKLGMVGRLVNSKDHSTLLKAIAELKKQDPTRSIKLMIAGDGEYKNELSSTAQELNIAEDVIFTGQLNELELVDFLRELDIYIHASLGETMSTAIMQAMASGKPIVASDVPGIHNMIEHGKRGLLVPAQDPEALARVLHELINNKPEQERLASAALTYAQENFSNLIMLDQYKQLFNN